uniref:Uncharacterized protein n=1 Tax=Leersia perrieri TaxID=77586 RepID=A0A0D9WE54_9ORYZ
MPSLVPHLLGAGICFGANIIANTLSFLPDEIREPEPNRKPKASEAILSKIVASDGPSPPEARTVAERYLEGLVSFLTTYFRHLPTCDALRYLSLARADLLVAVSLIEKDRCYRRKDQFRIRSHAVKIALKCAAWSARQPNFDNFFAGCFALVSHINKITRRTLSAKGCCRLTVQDISWLSGLLAIPLTPRSDKPMKLASKRFRFHDPEIRASIVNVPGELTESLQGVLMDRVHDHYLKAIFSLLKAGYCFGPFHPVSNIIMNTVWYDTAFPPSKEFEVDMIFTLRHVESRSVNGLITFLRACIPVISEHEAMVYLLKSNLDVCKAIQMAKSQGCDVSVCDDSGYKAAAKAASHPNLEAYCDAKSLDPTIELTKDALKCITNYKEDFLTQQSFVRRKVEAALRNYEQSKGCCYDLGVICGVNDNVGKETGIFDTKFQYTHANFWATQDNGTAALFFTEFSNDEDVDHKPFCYPVSGLSTQGIILSPLRCCYCELKGTRIMHPFEGGWEGTRGFEKIACGEHTITNEEIVSRMKLVDNLVQGIFVQDYIYLDPAQDAKLIQAVNRAEWVMNLNIDDEMRRIKSLPAGSHYSPQASFVI